MENLPLDNTWRAAVDELIREGWAGPMVATRGTLMDTRTLPGLVAVEDGRLAGYLLYALRGEGCEVAVLESLAPGRGVGSGLLAAAAAMARRAGCRRLWLVTTNDNTHATRFYQRQGMRLAALRVGAVDEARRTLKPGIPMRGCDNIPIRDELELELILDEA